MLRLKSELKFMKFKSENIMPFSLFTIIFLYSVHFILTALSDLRPIADDYCFSQEGFRGPINYITYWFNSWTGDLFAIFLSYILIAVPLANSQLGFGSFVTLGTTLLLLFHILVKQILFASGKDFLTKDNIFKYSQISLILLPAWLCFWFLPSLERFSNGNTRNYQLFFSILNWQTTNVSYVIAPLICFLLIDSIFNRSAKKPKLLVLILVGFIVGSSGYVTGLSIIIFLLVDQIFFPSFFQSYKEKLPAVALVISVSICFLLISFFSPGASIRKESLQVEYELISLLPALSNAIFDWISILISPGTIYAIFSGIAIFFAVRNKVESKHFENIRTNSLRLFMLSAIFMVTSRASEIFSYPAFWHDISTLTFLFIGSVLLGVFLAQRLHKKELIRYRPVAMSFFIALTVVATFTLNQSSELLNERKNTWQSGPAPSVGGTPADREIDWINKCWLNSKKLSKFY